MEKKIEEILEAYKNGEKTTEEANAELKAAGANFHLDDEKNPSGGWTQAEMDAGFLPGVPADPKPDKPDMGRVIPLAGQTVIQECRSGRYAVTYDELGYAVKAVKL